MNKKKKYFIFSLPVLGICMVLALMLLPSTHAVETVVGLDVNPSVELNLDDDYKIVDVKTNNEDGKKIVGDMNLTGSDIEVGVNALIGAMLKEGYIDELKNSLLISVTGDNEQENEKLREQLSLNIDELLKASDINGSIVSQTISNKDIEALAKQYQISVGKAEIIQQLVSKNSLYTFDSLKNLSIHELNLLLQSNQVDQVSITGNASESGYIGKEKAQQIALTDANVSNPEMAKVEMDYDDGVMIYEVEFYKNQVEYDYEINASTSQIIKNEKEYIGEVKITPEEAKQKAIQHAGLSTDNVYRVDVELDHQYYDVSFKSGHYEYEYEYKISALDGSILAHEKDMD